MKDQGTELGEAMLFFGCRHPNQDYLYREALECFDAQGIVSLHAAFSRGEGERTYVQDLIAQHSERVWRLIEQGARIYVCGDGAKMEPDVRKRLVAICSEKRGCSAQQGEKWIEEMIEQERYILDVWVG